MTHRGSPLVEELASDAANNGLKLFQGLHAYTSIMTGNVEFTDGYIDVWSSLILPPDDRNVRTLRRMKRHAPTPKDPDNKRGVELSVATDRLYIVPEPAAPSSRSLAGSPFRKRGIIHLHGVETGASDASGEDGVHWKRFARFTPNGHMYMANSASFSRSVFNTISKIEHDLTKPLAKSFKRLAQSGWSKNSIHSFKCHWQYVLLFASTCH